MSNSKWYAFKLWFFQLWTKLTPEGVKRQILYELNDRVNMKLHEDNRDFWKITTEEMYLELRD